MNARVLEEFPLLVPDLHSAFQFREIVGALREKVVANVEEEESLAALRDTLLPKLISGELSVPDVEKILEGVE